MPEKVCTYEYEEDEMKIKVNCLGCLYGASIEDFPLCMATTIDKIIEVKKVSRVVLVKEREYEYGPEKVSLLREIADIIEDFIKDGTISLISEKAGKFAPDWNSRMQYIVLNLMRRDPIAAYVELIREVRKASIGMKRALSQDDYNTYNFYIKNILEPLKTKAELTKIITLVKPHLDGYRFGDRGFYRQLFSPIVRPNFMLTRYMTTPPKNAVPVERYMVRDSQVEIYKIPGTTELLYFATPPEFKLSDEEYSVLDEARRYMAMHRPTEVQFVKTEKVRELFFSIGKDMIKNTADKLGVHLTSKKIDQLANILTRYTAGMGVLEILLADEKIQDLYVNSPIETQPIIIFHQDFEECRTNLIPTINDAEAWATRLRIISGRPLDEANPVLDAELEVPGGRARFAVITKTLSPYGLGFAVRRHRDKPWTLPLFMKNRMLSPLASGLFSFLIDGAVSMLIAGGRSSGKTSLLGSLLLEILPKIRIITVEDSVTGDSKIVAKDNGKFIKTTIGELIDKRIEKNGFVDIDGREKVIDPENLEIFSVDRNGKIVLSNPSKLIRHKTGKDIYEVETTSGKHIKVTEDHSLFTLDEKKILKPVKSKDIKEGGFIAIPAKLPIGGTLDKIDLLENLEKLGGNVFVLGTGISDYIIKFRKEFISIARSLGYKKPTIQNWAVKKIMPAKLFNIMKTDINLKENLFVKTSNSKPIPSMISLDEDFLGFAGLWLADGCYDKSSVIISVQEGGNKELVKRIAQRFNIPVKMHHDKFSSMLNSTVLRLVMQKILGLEGNAYTKKMPQWAYSLSDRQVGWIIKGFLSGDGCVSNKEIIFSICSRELIDDIETLLLRFGIILRASRVHRPDKTFNCRIGSTKMIKLFKDNIGFFVDSKQKKLELLASRISMHDTSDVIPLPFEMKEELNKILGKKFNRHDYIVRGNDVGREHLSRLLEAIPEGITNPVDPLRTIVKSDIFWDKVKCVRKIESSGYVYDISVPGNENFICDNIVAHNTLELPVQQLIDQEFNIERMKSRSVITRVETEVPADEALRTSLRLGDSALVIGEIRSVEAKALYEAMRIGALSNIVAGTLHGESAYGVYDRVVNDLGVPPTSFKATDMIFICKALRTADGLHRFRRLVEVTEVRKEWDRDPLKEGAFVNLMEYSSKTDSLKPTDTLVNGESEILNRIASFVKEYSGNWEMVWENINLRAKMKQKMVESAEKLNRPELLESVWTVKANQKFHTIAESIRNEIGFPDPARVWTDWDRWYSEIVRKKM